MLVKLSFGPFLAACTPCSPKIQLLHIQQATAAWRSVLQNLGPAMESVVSDLKAKYDFEYAAASFADKPAPVTGCGSGWGIWKSWPGSQDVCFMLETAGFGDENFSWKNVGYHGKDTDQNQWDALYRGSRDSRLNWNMSYVTRTGQPVIRAIVLVTDGFSHTAAGSDHIPGHGYNNSYRSITDHYNTQFGLAGKDSNMGWPIIHDFDGISGEWKGTSGRFDRSQLPGIDQYAAYLMCNDRGNIDLFHRNKFSRRLNDQFPEQFSVQYVKHEWDALCDENWDVLYPWRSDYKLVETESIKDYPYTHSDDCTKYEYPDPTSREYRISLQDFHPMILVMPTKPESANHLYLQAANSCRPEFTDSDMEGLADGVVTQRNKHSLLRCLRRHYAERLDGMTPCTLIVSPFASLNATKVAAGIRSLIEQAVRRSCKGLEPDPVVATPRRRVIIVAAVMGSIVLIVSVVGAALAYHFR
ncbi:MAG: hypothetical protein KVP17_004481 [Porospora cf. gigantea B]|uniref:uncharacterized protein n=1 Tax=Porospora cf. gigantea B TaxID=2853592 RepID=UPI003571A9B7|nr:MAG: hypothetical protein KVP17_004481 [Porospora cf. gigantea B]